jgi:hypothetical protein
MISRTESHLHPPSDFSSDEHLQCMSQITPVVIGISNVTRLIGIAEQLANYSGGRLRRRHRSEVRVKLSERRLNHLRRIEYNGGALNTRVGLGRGWEKMFQGVPVDSPRRKFKM